MVNWYYHHWVWSERWWNGLTRKRNYSRRKQTGRGLNPGLDSIVNPIPSPYLASPLYTPEFPCHSAWSNGVAFGALNLWSTAWKIGSLQKETGNFPEIFAVMGIVFSRWRVSVWVLPSGLLPRLTELLRNIRLMLSGKSTTVTSIAPVWSQLSLQKLIKSR